MQYYCLQKLLKKYVINGSLIIKAHAKWREEISLIRMRYDDFFAKSDIFIQKNKVHFEMLQHSASGFRSKRVYAFSFKRNVIA